MADPAKCYFGSFAFHVLQRFLVAFARSDYSFKQKNRDLQ